MKLPKKFTKRREKNETEDNLIDALDQLSQFEQWKTDVLPALQKDVAEGKSSQDLRDKYATMLTARLISIGLLEQKAAAAIVAIKDVLDRVEGKAVETKEVTHRLEKLSSDELDAMLKTKLRDLTDVKVLDVPTPEKET